MGVALCHFLSAFSSLWALEKVKGAEGSSRVDSSVKSIRDQGRTGSQGSRSVVCLLFSNSPFSFSLLFSQDQRSLIPCLVPSQDNKHLPLSFSSPSRVLAHSSNPQISTAALALKGAWTRPCCDQAPRVSASEGSSGVPGAGQVQDADQSTVQAGAREGRHTGPRSVVSSSLLGRSTGWRQRRELGQQSLAVYHSSLSLAGAPFQRGRPISPGSHPPAASSLQARSILLAFAPLGAWFASTPATNSPPPTLSRLQFFSPCVETVQFLSGSPCLQSLAFVQPWRAWCWGGGRESFPRGGASFRHPFPN